MTRTGLGEMTVSISKGAFRLVGGKISKNTPVVFNTPTATVAVRGGIAYLKEGPNGLEAALLFGDKLSMTSSSTGLTTTTFKAGRTLSLEPGAVMNRQT